MQSVTWEAVRGLFPAKFKTVAKKGMVSGARNAYRRGEMDIDQVRNYIRNLAGRIRLPDWYGQ
jgi:hypothetical protein